MSIVKSNLQFTLLTYYFQLVCYVVCDCGLGIKPEHRQQHRPQVCEEGANVGVRSQLQDDLEPHEHLGGYGGNNNNNNNNNNNTSVGMEVLS